MSVVDCGTPEGLAFEQQWQPQRRKHMAENETSVKLYSSYYVWRDWAEVATSWEAAKVLIRERIRKAKAVYDEADQYYLSEWFEEP